MPSSPWSRTRLRALTKLYSVPYAALVHTLSKIESTTKRLEIASYLTQFLTKVMQTTPGDLLKVVYLCINRLCPDYEGLELGLGESTLLTAISESTGRTEKQIKADYKQEGDLGTVAQVCPSRRLPSAEADTIDPLTELAQQTTSHVQASAINCTRRVQATERNCENRRQNDQSA